MLDGGLNTCSEDVDFSLAGFAVSGSVAVPAGCGAVLDASSVTLTLYTSTAGSDGISSEVVQRVQASASGDFEFPGVLPGAYVVAASHPSWSLAPVNASVEVTWGAARVPVGLAVAGFDVSGSISIPDAAFPAHTVHVYLYGANNNTALDAVGCEASQAVADGAVLPSPGAYIPKFKPQCVTPLQRDGSYKFAGVTCATHYTIVPLVPKRKTIAFLPKVTVASVTGGSVAITTPQKLDTFPLAGIVKAVTGDLDEVQVSACYSSVRACVHRACSFWGRFLSTGSP